MTYRERLTPWVIVRLLPQMQRVVVGRFYKWSDADGDLKLLRQLIPAARFAIVFDPSHPSIIMTP